MINENTIIFKNLVTSKEKLYQKKRKTLFLMMFFVIEFFLTITPYQICQNNCIFIDHGLFLREKYSLQLSCLQF